jgi:hypothetical protein
MRMMRACIGAAEVLVAQGGHSWAEDLARDVARVADDLEAGLEDADLDARLFYELNDLLYEADDSESDAAPLPTDVGVPMATVFADSPGF